MRVDELEVEALELDPVYERESPGLGVAFVAEVECTTQPERRQRPVRHPERSAQMRNRRIQLAATAVFGALVLSGLSVVAQQQAQEPPPMGFFITSAGLGDGANLGGLDGADAHCQTLAAAVGAGNRTWRAYLSTQGPGAVNARDRIGEGPWANAEGLIMATSVEGLHFDNSNFNWTHTLDENGNQFASRIDGDPDFTEHDVLTATRIDGTAFPAGEDRTCGNWTSNGEGSAMLGHADRYSFTTPGSPWNTAHPSRGCSQDDLVATGGAGLFYCFAID